MNKQKALAVLLFLSGVLFTSCEVEDKVIIINKEQLHHVWNLKKIVHKESGDTLIPPEFKISFLENNEFTVFTHFNYGKGEYFADDNKLQVHNVNLVERKPNQMFDGLVLNNLEGAFWIEGNKLIIFSDNDYDLEFHKSNTIDYYQGNLSRFLTDSIETNRYYTEEIFSEEYSAIYGKWFLYSVTCLHNDKNYFKPHFNFLEIKRNGIFGMADDFNLKYYGKVRILSRPYIWQFTMDKNSIQIDDYRQEYLEYLNQDSLILNFWPCRYYFKKVRPE